MGGHPCAPDEELDPRRDEMAGCASRGTLVAVIPPSGPLGGYAVSPIVRFPGSAKLSMSASATWRHGEGAIGRTKHGDSHAGQPCVSILSHAICSLASNASSQKAVTSPSVVESMRVPASRSDHQADQSG